MQTTTTDPACTAAQVLHCPAAGPACTRPDQLITEQALTIDVDQLGQYTILCTPTEQLALAAGFIFSEGIIRNLEDLKEIAHDPAQPDLVRARLKNPARVLVRNLVVASSCGLCGVRDLEKLMAGTKPCPDRLVVEADNLRSIIHAMRRRQRLFESTGACHGAALFDTALRVTAVAEDLGRHNALDKVIGHCLLNHLPLAPAGLALSGRVSLEMVLKAARAGFEIIAAVSAPSSLAVLAAKKLNITLAGFIRPHGANIYTHPHRILHP